MDSLNANAAESSVFDHQENTMTSVETNDAANVGGDQDAVGEAQLGVVGGSTQPQHKGTSLKTVASKDKGKKALKETLKKERDTIKVEDKKPSNEVEGLKSHAHGTLNSRMSPSSVVQVMKSVSPNQLKAVRAIGFGSMEFLKVTHLPLQLGLWLVQHFDAKTCSLNILGSDPFLITEEHVHEVLGLPIGGISIDENDFSVSKKVIKQWKEQFGRNSLSIKIGELKRFLKHHKVAGPMFKRNFIVLCVSTLISGKQNMNINPDILRFVSDVDKIKELNWSKYILDSLVKAKLYWEERPTRYFGGSLLFLMLLYADRFVIEEVRAAPETPILKGWTTLMLSTREKLEIFKGRFGNVFATKPDTGSSEMKQPKMERSDQIGTKNEETGEDLKKKCLMDLATASTNLVLAYMDFNVKHQQAVKYFPQNEKIQKLKEDALGICDEHRLSSEEVTKNQTLSFSQDDEYWQDPAVIEAWDMFSKISCHDKNPEYSTFARAGSAIETAGIDVSKIAVESVQIASTLLADEGPVGVVASEKPGECSNVQAGLKSSAEKGFGPPPFSLGLDSQHSDDMEKSASSVPTIQPPVPPVTADVGPSAAAPIVSVPKKRKPQPSMLLRSPFKSRVTQIYTPLLQVQRSILDAALDGSQNRLDTIFLSKLNGENDLELTRLHLDQLYTGCKIDPNVINAWCCILNYNEQFRDPSSPARFFFNLQVTDSLIHYEIDYVSHRNKMFYDIVEEQYKKSIVPMKDIQLYFFPVFEAEHYYVVCFNTTTEFGNIGILYYGEDSGDHSMFLKHLISAVCNFVKSEGSLQSVRLSKDIRRIEKSVITSPSISSDLDHLHCGVAAMRIMETYMGLPKWDSGLKKNNVIIMEKLREKYCLSIIISEVNTIESVKQIPQQKKKQHKVSVKPEQEEKAEKEKSEEVAEEEKAEGRKKKRLKKPY